VLSSCRALSLSRPTTEVARQSTAAPRRGGGRGGDDGGDDQREPGGARAAGARRPPRARGARRARRLRYGAGHQGPGAPLLAGAAQRALPGVRLRRRQARPHPIDIKVAPGSLANEESVNKQLNDKERVAAALENPNLRQLVDDCLCSDHPSSY
uniref:Uncharacterized protein n=1 Tax=Aegilops tauschii subsp. strangulata TaxID=200361 RepID=A0A453LWB8_AEGTS